MRIISKEQLAVRHAASDDETRVILNGVYIEEKEGNSVRTVATNGRILAIVDGAGDDEGQFPKISALDAAPNTADRAIIPTEAINKAIKGIDRKVRLPILKKIALKMSDGTSTLVTTNLENCTVTPTRNIEGNFPNYEQVIPADTKTPAFQIRIGVDMLERLVSILNDMGSDGANFHFYAPLEAVKVTDKVDDNRLTVVLMPMKS